ncbi:hypothetical protein [Rhizorhabdus dicambivorans]|uniref:Uncharacterized protein n=1 Tax=Rhizorhabdus dicambivorans TaxID=1850238 RepID=A0A2A4FNA0_9SPHN|nr:hypothetical protein [Rhizorhabdus dicambivorans]ATE66481.1 hypothetical protein CMV14_20445 [Rhizorhabdus dicambivorans]PCE39637.1 hypothetical protein COO09_24525 [Rhizorhabdus dicambivorans]
METRPLQSVGLGGDGDEIEAIHGVEETFGVKLDRSEASSWRTAGDVFAALQNTLPPAEQQNPALWMRFAVAICGITGADPRRIEPASPLLSEDSAWQKLRSIPSAAWIASLAALMILVAAALIRG